MMDGEYIVTSQLNQKRDKSYQLKTLNRNLGVIEMLFGQQTSF